MIKLFVASSYCEEFDLEGLRLGKDHRGGKAIPARRDGYTTNRFSSYLASRPKGAAVLILTLAVAVVLVLAGLALVGSHFDRAPYPSEKVPLKLDHDNVIYTQENTYEYQYANSSVVIPYAGMKILFRVTYGETSITMPVEDFGNESLLSAAGASVHQVLMTSSWANVSIDITESTGDGAFDAGDTIVFDIVPLKSDMVFNMGLLWNDNQGGGAVMDMSFAIHDGKLCAWYSHDLSDTRWYWPFLRG
jgi:hypothetical protein